MADFLTALAFVLLMLAAGIAIGIVIIGLGVAVGIGVLYAVLRWWGERRKLDGQ